ncbi:[FeFe] hydrogenase H-cluster maturation GTPase HydF [Parasutterella secunda]|jgi:hydrogenase maturation GTPase hydF|uniref:[FeFe] hydrogenase H-cluster maturation GTPase HydF n=1 Tax=Parasutterella secunda TaxID=626947 RepID=UPI0021AC1171|nr:[FeFe] hydrogenase H-cluster maturation GTPase HydF [Parasutterella secunda]MCR8920289.1 [FeFe] hydrogenase H-cluster maturation GTPase HydF [Parasutterella secunda]
MATSRMETPKGLRLHFGLFGKRNAGKSSLINALANQNISIVSSVAGTTTDPVEKAFELSPIGPVVFMDTAGIDDEGDLGLARVEKSLSVLEWMDIAIVVCEAGTWGSHEENILKKTLNNGTPTIVVFNKTDLCKPTKEHEQALRSRGYKVIETSAANREGISDLRDAIIQTVLEKTEPDRPLMGELAKAGDTVLLVTPIDTGAPKGRLILPQVQAIRELLDAGAKCFVIKEDRITETLNELKQPPQLVVTDSQVVLRVVKEVPEPIPVTTFSIQMAYSKSDLLEMAIGAAALTKLKPGDKVLIAETCSHHPLKDDIGRVKIPNWLRKTFGDLNIDIAVGKDFPTDLTPYKVIIQCGGCIVTRRHMLARLRQAKAQGVPMTNYGVTISYLQGVLPRVLACHPDAKAAFDHALKTL